MDAEQLKALQAPLKQQYKENPRAALITLKAEGSIGEGVTCKVDTGRAIAEAGLHPATGGDGSSLCS
ncbi:MAG TPA: OsmC family peroxiredoxin, partial [Gammaproteobacteria bacterium]|nr:OsmC family peroxiredoxin [Gammaproteobacteria bacterium]